jgi:hypothetical protein
MITVLLAKVFGGSAMAMSLVEVFGVYYASHVTRRANEEPYLLFLGNEILELKSESL